MATHAWFIRHGEVEAPFVGAFVGRIDVPLSQVGHHQAEAVATFLDGVPLDAILTSPRQRAMQTSTPLAEATGIKPTVVEGLAEMHFGDWEGLNWEAIEARDEQFAQQWQIDPMAIPCPGGESAGGFAKRVQEAWGEVLEEYRGQHIAVFAHAGTNRALLADITGMPYMDTFCFAQDYGCLNAGQWQSPGQAQLALLNVVPGPRSGRNGDGGRSVEEA